MDPRNSKLKSLFCFRTKPSDFADSAEHHPTRKPQEKAKINPPGATGPKASSGSAKARPSSPSESSLHSGRTVHRVRDQLKAFNIRNFNTLRELAIVGIDGDPIDDRSFLMERVIQLAAELPVSSGSSNDLTKAFLSQLWNDLQHPPQSFLGNDYKYRKADGSYNNILWPHIGAAGQPYARTVQPKRIQPVALPDPGVIFDSVLTRRAFKPHPTKISSVLFYLATVIIHDLFHTSHVDFSISETSSYLDLAPLYGSSQEDQNAIRSHKDGMLKPDCFSDKRVLGFPPGVGLLLIMFNRFHNNVAQNLAQIDQNGQFSNILSPPGRAAPGNARELYDEALFQTARLVTSGLYVNIILKDYVRTILNLNRTDTLWDLDPRSEEGRIIIGDKIPEATGNQVSAEFNLIYRWHACISERDEKWTEAEFERLLGAKREPTQNDLLRALQEWSAAIPADPQLRTFAELGRTSTGKYSDDDLATLWTASVEDVAGSFGANHVPKIMRDVEILGIMQARSWNLASLNEFRAYFKLQPHKTFEDINPEPLVAQQLKHLYGHPDNVELYPGLIVESAKTAQIPGSGLCTNFTISRGVLSDAVGLVRGDRFYTIDYNAKALTNWGFEAAHYDLSVDYGCVIYKLVLNALPQHYRYDSIYAHFPLVIPSENEKILGKLGKLDLYNFEKPTSVSEPILLRSPEACSAVLENEATVSSLSSRATDGFDLGNMQKEISGGAFAKQMMDEAMWQEQTSAFYRSKISELLTDKAYEVAGVPQIDIIQDVLNAAHMQLIAAVLLIPLKNEHNSHGAYELPALLDILDSIHQQSNAQASPRLRSASAQKQTKEVQRLASLTENQVRSINKAGLFKSASANRQNGIQDTVPVYGRQAIQRFADKGLSPNQIVWMLLLPLAASMMMNLSRLSAQCIALLMGKGDSYMPEIQRLAHETSTDSKAMLDRYGLEAVHFGSSVAVSRRVTTSSIVEDGAREIHLKPGEWVICDLTSNINFTPSEPLEFKLNRDLTTYSWAKYGPELDMIKQISAISITAVLRALGGLDGVSRVPGPQGRIKHLSNLQGVAVYLDTEEREYVGCPRSMKVSWSS